MRNTGAGMHTPVFLILKDHTEGASGLATPTTVTGQVTPTVDPTMTALEKEKLAQEIDQLKNQNYWAWTTIGPILVGFAGLFVALYSFISQAFDLAVAYLRLRNIGPEPEPADSLNQALIRVFRESFPLARDLPEQSSQSLDALVK
jgi:hypothetical protein